LVGHVSVAPGLVFDRLVMLGMSEGRFPPRRLEDSLLPDVERQAAGGHLRLRTQRVHDDRRHLLAAIAGAQHAVLCQPRGDLRRSTDQPASRWLLADAARLAGLSVVESGDLISQSNAPGSNTFRRSPVDWRTQVYATGIRSSTCKDRPRTLINRCSKMQRCAPNSRWCARVEAPLRRVSMKLAGVAAEIGLPAQTSATR
jgi:hypothetical protein